MVYPFTNKKVEAILASTFLFIPFLFFIYHSDPSYAIGWLVLSLLLFFFQYKGIVESSSVSIIIILIYIFCCVFIHPIRELDIASNGQYLLLILLLFTKIKNTITKTSIFKATLLLLWALVFITVLVSAIRLFYSGYSHENTYNSVFIFSHRNLQINYFILISIFLIRTLKINQSKLKIVILIMVVTALVFQVKTAFIIAILSHLFFFRNVWKLYLIGLVVLLCSNIPRFISYHKDKVEYTEEVAAMPSWKKNFDLLYLTTLAGSSNDRINTWIWTLENINFVGHGSGSWKVDSQGKISLRDKECSFILRRPHNDFLLIIYELGILGIFICVLIIYTLWGNKLWILLPLFMFSFPLERAGFISLFLLIEPIKFNIPYHSFFYQIKDKLVPIVTFFCVLIFTAVFVAYRSYYHWEMELASSNKSNLSGQYTSTKIIPRDFLLNHHLKYRAFAALKTGDQKTFSKHINYLYKLEPNFYTTYILYRDINLIRDKKHKKIPYKFKNKNNCE